MYSGRNCAHCFSIVAVNSEISVFNSSIDLIQQCTEISKLPYIKNIVPDLADSLKDYFDVAHSTGNMLLDINRIYLIRQDISKEDDADEG